MRKLFHIFVESIFWLQLFLLPVLIGGVIAVVIFIRNENLVWLSIAIAAISIILGVIYAERIRRKHGTSRYLARIMSTGDEEKVRSEEKSAERSEKCGVRRENAKRTVRSEQCGSSPSLN